MAARLAATYGFETIELIPHGPAILANASPAIVASLATDGAVEAVSQDRFLPCVENQVTVSPYFPCGAGLVAGKALQRIGASADGSNHTLQCAHIRLRDW